jgi:xylan 1,4-beta-xylosidase
MAILPRKAWRVALAIVLASIAAITAFLAFLLLRPVQHAPESKLVGPPLHVLAVAGSGQVTVRWDEVNGAVRYQVFRGEEPNGKAELASTFDPSLPRLVRGSADYFFPDQPFEGVPHSPFVDTFVQPGHSYHYSVVASDGSLWGAPSRLVSSRVPTAGSRHVDIRVDAAHEIGTLEHKWEIVLGSDHLSYMLKGDLNSNLRAAGSGLRRAHKRLHDDFGIRYIRAHGILMDDLSVYREDPNGRPVYDWTGIDRIYDMLKADGVKPVVEFSFMPSALAFNPAEMGMVTRYFNGIVSKPRDYSKWGALVGETTKHLTERYGREEVESWYFEVWNEPDFRVPWMHGFWTGSDEEYFRLYDFAAQAVKSVNPNLRVGGPVAATSRIIEPFLKHVTTENFATGGKSVPLDFLDLHMYFAPPFYWRPVLQRYRLGDLPVFVSEWGVDTWWGREENDLPYGAAWTARGLFEGLDQASIISYWCGSDYYEENGPPQKFFHGGFGLLGIDEIRKSRYWAFHLLHQLGHRRLALDGDGDGFGGLVQGWATRADDGALRILLWNVTFDQTKSRGSAILDRQVGLHLAGLTPNSRFRLRHFRVDNTHSNVYGDWLAMGKPDWPNAGQLAELHRRDELQMLAPGSILTSNTTGNLQLDFTLPMPALSLIELANVP